MTRIDLRSTVYGLRSTVYGLRSKSTRLSFLLCWCFATLICYLSFPLAGVKAQETNRAVKVDRLKSTRDIAVEDEPKPLHTFVEQHGRITSIGLAGDTGQFIHTDAGLLDQVLYENGYTDYYTYSDNEYIIEVIREDDQGLIESVFTFDFIRGTGAKWDAQTDTTIRKVFDHLDPQFYEQLVFTEFQRQKLDVQAKGGSLHVVRISTLVSMDCVCQYGPSLICDTNDDKVRCVDEDCPYKGKRISCVWRGAAF